MTFLFRRRIAEILGPQDAPNVYADSNRAFCPSSLLGETNAVQSGGDSLITFSHNSWASYLRDGYTEFIEASQCAAAEVESSAWTHASPVEFKWID
jgi:hypothetical protein